MLGLPERDAKIEEYKTHLRNLGKAGIPYTTYAHMANGIWSTERETTRGGAPARAFDLAKADTGTGLGANITARSPTGASYSEDEIWDNFAYFIKQVVPVAEEAGVRIGIHPDDPPVPELGGVPRCIFSSFEGYRRALEIADSPNVGMCLCVGCWLEGGAADGQGRGRDHPLLRRAQEALQGALPQRRPAPAALRRDLHRRRLYGYVPGDEGPARGRFRRRASSPTTSR